MQLLARRRKSIRLRGYDYSESGGYFITVCTKDREHLLGEVRDGGMVENGYGKIVRECWNHVPKHYSNVELDEFVVMPNHVHGIMFIMDNPVGTRHASPLQAKRNHLGDVIGSFKSAAAKRINEMRKTPGVVVWQRGFYDHIIRDDKSLKRIRDYIIMNPERWRFDTENSRKIAQDEFDTWLRSKGRKLPKHRGGREL
jgi:REP element-mobilizing transposase RayT